MQISISLTSESASKKMQDNAKLFFGAKGAKLITAYDELNKATRRLNEDATLLVYRTGLFLKASYEETAIAKLKKRKGFSTLVTRMVTLAKTFAAHDKESTTFQAEIKIAAKINKVLAKNIQDAKSAKEVPVNAHNLWKSNGKKVIAALKKLKADKRKLGDVEKEYITNVDALLRSKLGMKSVRLSDNAHIKNLPKNIQAMAKGAKKYISTLESYTKQSKTLKAFSNLMSKEAGKASTSKIAKAMDKTSAKAAKASTGPETVGSLK